MKVLTFCLSICVLLCGMPFAAADDVFSIIDGYEAIRELISNTSRQEELDLAPDQIDELKRVLLTLQPRITELDRKAKFEIRDPRARPKTNSFADPMIRPELRRILLPEQVTARRQFYLRRRFGTPGYVFGPAFLNELNLNSEDVAKVQDAVSVVRIKSQEKMQAERDKAVAEILGLLSDKASLKFAELFGDQWVKFETNSKLSLAEIEILPESRPRQQLRYCTMLLIPGSNAITVTQRTQLLKLLQQELIMDVRMKGANRDDPIRESLSKILSPKQHIAIVQRTHAWLFELDMFVLTRPQVATYLGLSEDTLNSLKPVIQHWDASIKKLQKIKDFAIYDAGLAALPIAARKQVEELFDGVWER